MKSGKEKVILLNVTNEDTALGGWQLVDRLRRAFVIRNVIIGAGSTAEIRITAGSSFNLTNQGGTISLLNGQGIETSGVQYTTMKTRTEGRLVRF